MILSNTTIVLDGRNLSGASNQVALDMSRTQLDATTFQSGDAKLYKAGMKDATATVSGFWDADIDGDLDSLADQTGYLVIAPDLAVGSRSYALNAKCTSFNIGGEIDGLLPWSATFANARRSGIASTTIMHDPTNELTTAGASSGVQLGALTAGQSYAFHVHVFSIAGVSPEVTLQFQHSSTNGWSSPTTAETDAFTLGDVATVVVDGPITDTWWRINASAVSGAALFIVIAEKIG